MINTEHLVWYTQRVQANNCPEWNGMEWGGRTGDASVGICKLSHLPYQLKVTAFHLYNRNRFWTHQRRRRRRQKRI